MSTGAKVAIFGLYGLFSIGGIVAIISRTVFAQPVVVQNEGEELYRQGLRLFAAGDYELAKGKFTDAANLVKDAPEPLRYARLCDTELAARTSLKNAERALVNRRYTEAVRALDAVESTSVYYDQATRQRKDTAPKAAQELYEDARRLASENPTEASSRLKTALELDPTHLEARDLLGRLRGGTTVPASPTARSTSANPPPSAATVAAVTRETREPRSTHAGSSSHAAPVKGDDDGDLAAVKVGKGGQASSGPPADSKAGMAAYKARDFAGAVKLLRAL
jgi:tetratricopeptide (TPR) repeat protein